MHTNRSKYAHVPSPAQRRAARAAGGVALLAFAGLAVAGPLTSPIQVGAAAVHGAMAQASDAGFVVVTAGGANMRCADSDRFYVVSKIAEGTVLKSEGASGNWTIVRYPANTPAFVRVEHVKVEGDVATTSVPTALKALNAASGFAGSYKSLLNQELPVGTKLKVIEAVREGDGPVVAYKVVAPEGARGYIDGSSLRAATEAEAKAAAAAMGISLTPPAPTTPAPTTPAPNTPAPTNPTPSTNPAATPTATPSGTPDAAPSGTPSTNPAGAPVVDLTQPGGVPAATDAATTPGTTGTDPVTITQGGSNPGLPLTVGPTGTTTPAATPGDVAPVDPTTRRVGTVEQLEQTFQRVWREPVMSSEVDELIAEYDRAIARETSEGRRRALTQRLEALKIRKDFRDRAIRQQEDVARYDQSKQTLTEQLLIVERGRVYTIIGELQPSTVYDGDRLPLMFRVVSVGGVAPRTLGYLRPTQEFPLKQMVGQVVGVIGDSTLDPSLKLNVITPVRVDVMRPGELGRIETREIPWPGEVARPANSQPSSSQPGTIRPVPPAEEPAAEPATQPEQTGGDSESPDTAPAGSDSGDGGLIPVPPR